MYPSLRSKTTQADVKPKGLQVRLSPVDEADEVFILDEVKDYLRVGHGEDDALIMRLVAGIRGLVEKEIGRALVRREAVAEWRLFYRQGPLPYPPHGEVTKVERVTDEGLEEVPAADYQTRGLDRLTIYVPRRMSLSGYREEGLRVTYEAGYSEGDPLRELPPALRMQMLRDIKSRYDYREEFTTGTIVAQLPDPSAYDKWRVYG